MYGLCILSILKSDTKEKSMSDISKYIELNEKFLLKYSIDRILACILFAISVPVLLAGVFIIKLYGWFNKEESGSIFYKEPRISAGKIFYIIKFRTVTQDTVNWIKSDPDRRSITAAPNITRAGKIILNWYLDELPQLFNIAKGDMSFVGPRPHILNHHRKEIELGLVYRNVIKAGLLGIPQVCKRRPEYAALLKEMARTHKPVITALNKLDALYAFRCMRKTSFEILLYDINIIIQGFVVIVRGVK